MRDSARLSEAGHVGAGIGFHEPVRWHCAWKVEKYRGDDTSGTPYEVIADEGNMLLYGGASALWHRLTGGTTVAAFDSSNARLGVGDSTTAEAATQQDLQASTNKLRKAMDSTYPQHTDATTSGGASVVFKSTFGTSDANFAWNEWGIFNAASSGRMLNRRVESLGTKTSSASWVLTVTLTLASS